MSDVPFVAIGADELGEDIGEEALCTRCGETHTVEYGTKTVEGKQVPSKMLGFVKCGENSYLVSINGKRIDWKR